jgi:preprotein translocase subunit SecA
MFTLQSNFIGDFKLGDNIAYNLDVIGALYEHYAQADAEERRLLCKPITVLLVTIVEAVLHDFHFRIAAHTREGVRGVAESVLEYVRGKKIDKLAHCIDSAKKHNFLRAADNQFYDELDQLRRLRNRLHIQNYADDFAQDDLDTFTEARKVLAERALERTVRVMAEHYSRRQNYVRDFHFPWESHFPPAR